MPHEGRTPGRTYAAAKARLEERIAREPANADLGLELGMLALVEGDLRTAESSIRRASDLVPDDPRPHVRLADVYAELDRLDEAAEEYARALELAGDDPVGEEARAELAIVERELQMVHRPLGEMRAKAVAEEPSADDLNRLGCLELLAGGIEKAADAFRRALEADPLSLGAALNFGLVQGLASAEPSRLKRSVSELLAAAKRFPEEPRLQLHLAELYEASSLYDASTQRVERALEIAPLCLEAYDIAARYLLLAAAPAGGPSLDEVVERIVSRFEEELKEDPERRERKRSLGLALLGRARYRAAAEAPPATGPREGHGEDIDRACSLLEDVIDHDEEVTIRLAECREKTDRRDDADALLRRAVEEHPTSHRPVFELAGLRLRSGAPEEAVELFARSAELAPGDAAVYQSLRYALSVSRALRVAELVAAVSLARDPDSAEARVRLGTAYIKALRLDAAAETLAEATRLAPESAEAHTALGRALARLARPEDAERSFRRAMEVAPGSPEAHRRLGELLLARPGRMREGLEELEEYRRLRTEGGKR